MNLENEFSQSLNETFKSDAKNISDILNIPSNILLNEDSIVRDGVGKDIDLLKSQIHNLKKVFQGLIYLKNELLNELEDADSTIIFMENFINSEKLNLNIKELCEIKPVNEMCTVSKENREKFSIP